MQLTKEEIARLRIRKSGLVHPFESPVECITNLFGIQSQAQQFGEISILNRVKKIKPEDMKKLYNSYDIIKIWGQRMTVHMYVKEDWKKIHQVYAHRNNFVKRGWADKTPGLKTVLSEIEKRTAESKVSKEDLTGFIEELVPHIQEPYRDYSIFLEAGLQGIVFGIPEMPQTRHFVHRSICIPQEEFESWNKEHNKALDYMLLNYFRHYGPATLADFCHWSGLTRGEALKSLKNIEELLVSFSYDKKEYFLPLNDPAINIQTSIKSKAVKLLGKFDPLFVSFSDKSWIADVKQQKAIWRPAAHIEAVLLVEDQLSGTWRYAIKGKKISFSIMPFKNIPAVVKRKIEPEAKRIADYLSKEIDSISYT